MSRMADVSLAVRNDDSTLPEGQTPERIARELAALIEGEVRFSFHDRMLYATDASIYQVVPIGVVVPRHVEDVEAVVKYCPLEKLPILPLGGGTALAGTAGKLTDDRTSAPPPDRATLPPPVSVARFVMTTPAL